MTKKRKNVLAVSVSAIAVLAVSATVGVFVCRKIYEKKYFSAD